MGLSRHNPLVAVAEGRTFVLRDFPLMEKRSTFEYLSVGSFVKRRFTFSSNLRFHLYQILSGNLLNFKSILLVFFL